MLMTPVVNFNLARPLNRKTLSKFNESLFPEKLSVVAVGTPTSFFPYSLAFYTGDSPSRIGSINLVLSSLVLMPPKLDSSSSATNDNAGNPIAALHAHMIHIAQLSTDTNAKLDQLIQLMTNQLANQNPPPPPPPSPPPPRYNNQNIRPPKILLSTFDGSNPLDWIFQAENYFTYYNIPPPQRLSLVVFYFTGDALSLYKYLSNNRLLGTWQEFSRALELRFGPSTYENHQATLFKLHQTTTVSAYQSQFEKLSNRVTDLGPEALLNCFISGLRYDIQNEIALHHPTSLHQAYGLAKLVEDKLHAHFPSSDALPDPPPTNPLPIKKLTPTEMQKRRAEGLCYNCPAKYQPGHQCNPPKFLLLQSETDPPWPSMTHNNFGLEDKAIFQGGCIDTNTFL